MTHPNSLANLVYGTKTAKFRIGAHSNALIIKALLDGVLTIPELAEESGLHQTGVRRYLRALERVSAVHISHWEPDDRGGMTRRVFKLGVGKNAKAPVKTPAQRNREYRARQRMKNHPILRLAA